MAEGSTDAMLMVTISFQALQRVKYLSRKDFMVTDCTIVIFFIAVFLESTLNYIIDEIGMTKIMIGDLGWKSKYPPGLGMKMTWFYNEFIARDKAKTKRQLKTKKILSKAKGKFRGFHELSNFRNKVAHGGAYPSLTNPQDADRLRMLAKGIVDDLYRIGEANNNGLTIDRIENFDDVLDLW